MVIMTMEHEWFGEEECVRSFKGFREKGDE
jgi:hypothetical protein